jgi:hypothetical protein
MNVTGSALASWWRSKPPKEEEQRVGEMLNVEC